MNKIRTFFAVDTPPHIKVKMTEVQMILKESGADVKWESAEKFHITMKFLGDVFENVLAEATKKLTDELRSNKSFTVTYRGLGCFPNLKDPRVVWIGCENPDGELSKIKDRIEAVTIPYGYPSERREFSPHITLGRVKGHRGVKDMIDKLKGTQFTTEPTICDEILVMKSDLRPTGSVYTILNRIKLST
jgi:2'-5' RNA ligase